MGRKAAAPPSARAADPDLVSAIQRFEHDPLGFVLFVFPWGQPGTPLADEPGPDFWQADVLQTIGEASAKGAKELTEACRIAVASGHGIGKSALVSWIILWFISCKVAPQIVVTANTERQLTTKTWRELAKWWRISVHKEWFQWTATKFYMKDRAEDWFAAAIPWSEQKSEAFAGTHEKTGVLMLFDEASTIPETIWDSAEGAMTTQGAYWIVFGNPTRNTGRFRECFRRFRHRWITKQIDSRTARMANRKQLDQWVADYGEDSDFVRVRIKGQFPRAGTAQLISFEDIEVAQRRHETVINGEPSWKTYPLVMGVDPARFGDDRSVIYIRQGPKTLRIMKYTELDTMQLAWRVIEQIKWCEEECGFQPDGLFVDANGIGAGVADMLRHQGYAAIDVMAGEKALDSKQYFNARAQMWWLMREWIKKEAIFETGPGHDQELIDDLTSPEYGYDNQGRIQLETKDDMKDRGLPSPDIADALAMTFYMPVANREVQQSFNDKLQDLLRDHNQHAGSTTFMAV